jgi:hypothetical protein
MLETNQHVASSPSQLLEVSIITDGVLIDAEAGRIARLLGQFGVYRAWAYAHSIDDGDGWVEREALEMHWRKVSVASSTRHTRRIIQQGIEARYLTQDKTTKRIYLKGQVKVAAQLVETGIEAGYHHLTETNKPGKRWTLIDLSGSIQ